MGPEEGLGGTDSLLELHHSNRNSQMAVAHWVWRPSASLFFPDGKLFPTDTLACCLAQCLWRGCRAGPALQCGDTLSPSSSLSPHPVYYHLWV